MSHSQFARSFAKPFFTEGTCVFCQSRGAARIASSHALGRSKRRPRSIAAPTSAVSLRRPYASSATQKLDVQRLRHDVDERSRLGFYTLTKKQGALHMEAATANSIVKEFLHRQKTMDHKSNIEQLVSRYKTSVEDLASLAIVTYRIPDLSDSSKRALLAPSQHKPLAAALLQGCAQAEDPLAIIQILTAVYLARMDVVSAKELAALFPQSEIAKYRKSLAKLGLEAKSFALGPDVLTLQGLFAENEGHKEEAKSFYIEAIQRGHFKYNPKSRHPMQLPLITPWNALGYLLKADKDPDVRNQAETYFRRGAIEADDPLSYYELASFEERTNPKWLQYTSKAAASGHLQATLNLADFYRDVSLKESPVLVDSRMRDALNWLLGWKQGSAVSLAREWLQAASNMGHKPSTLHLADYCKSIHDEEGEQSHLRRLLDSPSSTSEVEAWPQLVQVAKKRLAGIT
ncbi:hypothetical protein FB567DRAFT_563536 [Paraphoma chrysanthemicola]|uniref:Uncharacterized protein n=1 Tax=Paraphoma chrysanthemicola TaxID=798071 RepID=A0A8K0QZ54_9PLEO|nr:hypothetical protein FB567DRAFT_563536 [Paraphoma chrysanthemicola]